MLLALGVNKLGSYFGSVPGAQAFRWAYLLFGLGEWACVPIFQTLSVLLFFLLSCMCLICSYVFFVYTFSLKLHFFKLHISFAI